jgi:RHS repeat-associated protein
MTYDEVGNLTLDTYTSALTAGMQYDADNKMTSAANGGQQYRYNADGERVKRIITGAGGGTYWMVYGLGGELVAEYNATSGIPAVTSPSKEYGYRGGQMLIVAESTTAVKWLVQDHLGSTRMEIGVGGAIGDVTRHDYLPFGEELAGSMRSGNGYGTATNTKQKFTGYERDDETGLDFAQARMYASIQGRFTSVDPDGIGAAISEPQSWNGYAYCGNRPTTLTDSSGLLWVYNENNGNLYYSDLTSEQWQAKYGNLKHWKIVDGAKFTPSKSGWTSNGVYLLAGASYTLNSSGSATNNHTNTEITPIPYITAFHDSDVSMGVVKLWFYSAQVGAGLGAAAYQAGGFTINAIGQVVKEEVKDQAQDLMLTKLEATFNSCFVAGTPVKTLEGDIPIEEIQAGDIVLSYNVESGELEYKQVARTYIRESDDLYDLSIQGEEKAFRVTATHPFFARPGCPSVETEGKWIRVDELRTGFEVMNPNGNWVRITKLHRVKGKFKVYNFEVVDNHDYFVGLQGVLVHNDCTTEVENHIEKKGGTHVRVSPEGGNINPPESLYSEHIQKQKAKLTPGSDVARWNYHDVAVKNGMVYDPYANKKVMPFGEWRKQWEASGIAYIIRKRKG